MAVASQNSLCAREIGRLKDHAERDCADCYGDQLAKRDRHSADVKDNIVDQRQLILGHKDSIHVNSLNLSKTRYKYISISTEVRCSMMLSEYGKQSVFSFYTRGLGSVLRCFLGVAFEKSKLTLSIFMSDEVASC